jgi:hypothetical protein
MPRDEATSKLVRTEIRYLRQLGVRVAELEVHPSPVSTELLHHNGTGLDLHLAARVAEALQAAGFFDDQFFLLTDPWSSSWATALLHLEVEVGGFGAGTSRLDELLNIAFAMRGCVSRHFMQQIIQFCEDSGMSNNESIAKLP